MILMLTIENQKMLESIKIFQDTIRQRDERIKRLEEAGDAMSKWLDRNTPVTVRNDWCKAKEDKPCHRCLRSECECSDFDVISDMGDK